MMKMILSFFAGGVKYRIGQASTTVNNRPPGRPKQLARHAAFYTITTS